ncbi:hypothetical protein [Natranaerofaba carboxydovora]|uniref:hypothetical protein n=1 Tax=Natranaerofaba carboxydovora TaxID=2742683 RepID=UPI001F12D6AF|nr:hypothetical protein [Natranaerofaba carboxydovora]UMZ73668.1 hypothetical protein ACONDI_01231 [Natranaerofaba carboxydovora]
MENIKYLILILLLVISIGTSMSAFNKTNELERAINNIEGLNRNEYNSLSSRISSLNNSLRQLKEAEKWIVSKDFHPNTENSTQDEIILDLAWSFRELEKDASVLVEYSSNGKDWTRQEADKISDTSYLATLNLEPEKTYKYRFVASGEVYKSSDENIIPNHYYKPALARITNIYHGSSRSMAGPSNYGIELFQDKPIFDFFEVKDIYMDIEYQENNDETIKLDKGKLSDKIDSNQHDFSHRTEVGEKSISDFGEGQIFSASKDFDKEVKRISIRAIYKNGLIHEGELWPSETYYLNIYP